MKLTVSDYLELPAPLPVAATALGDPSAWAGAFGAERVGELWRYGAELYTLDASVADGGTAATFRWRAEPAAGVGPRASLTVTLRDAVISSHADICLEVTAPGRLWLGAPRARRALRRATRAAAAALTGLLRDEETAIVPARQHVAATVAALPEGGIGLDDGRADLDLADRTPAQRALVEAIRTRYPLTAEHFLAMGALDHLEHVARLERGWERIMRGEYDAGVHRLTPTLAPLPAAQSFELIYAGGGLGLLHAAVMAARYGRRVMVFDRGEVGCAHREWNISRDELRALVQTGVVSWDDLAGVVMREYRNGLVRFFNRPASDVPAVELWLPDVLNVALDAGALLRLMRRKLEAAGGTVLNGRAFRGVRAASDGPPAVEVELENVVTGAVERYGARLLLDGMGSTSPLALQRQSGRPFASVCPTVGTVATGFVQGDGPGEYDPGLGDILTSVADAQRGEQLMWEGFPGRGDELTTYLFYYSTIGTAGAGSPERGLRADAPRYSLLDLFEQYFLLLPTYKRPGPDFRYVKPVYGYIPARHSLRRQEAPLLRGVLPVGDSAAQQSPLTFCGFGSHVRNLHRTTLLLDYALEHGVLESEHLAAINPFQTNVSTNWIFSRFMHPWHQADDVNRLQNLFFGTLLDMGAARATRFFRDQTRWSDYFPMLNNLFWRWPRIVLAALKVVGADGIAHWLGDYLRLTLSAATAALARVGGPPAEGLIAAAAEARNPALGLRVRAAYEEWRAMGWI
jgi:lycopene cyclase CruA